MLKNKSPEDINRVSNEGLFTELTPKEASGIEGGAALNIFQVNKLGGPKETVCLYVNGEQIWKGETNTAINQFKAFQFSAYVELKKVKEASGNCGGDECGDVIGAFSLSAGPVGGSDFLQPIQPDPNNPPIYQVIGQNFGP